MSDEDRIPVTVPWIIIASLAAALVLTGLMQGPASDRFPTEIEGLDVSSVSQAVEVRVLDAASDLAVKGWYVVEPIPPCMPPEPGDPPAPELDDPCRGTASLYEDEGGTGSRLDLLVESADAPVTRPNDVDGSSIAVAVVMVGHFDDPRAADCAPDRRPACRDRFVATGVPWIEP